MRALATSLPLALVLTLVPSASSAPAWAADRDCSDFTNQREAQRFFLRAGGPAFRPPRPRYVAWQRRWDRLRVTALPVPIRIGATVEADAEPGAAQ